MPLGASVRVPEPGRIQRSARGFPGVRLSHAKMGGGNATPPGNLALIVSMKRNSSKPRNERTRTPARTPTPIQPPGRTCTNGVASWPIGPILLPACQHRFGKQKLEDGKPNDFISEAPVSWSRASTAANWASHPGFENPAAFLLESPCPLL